MIRDGAGEQVKAGGMDSTTTKSLKEGAALLESTIRFGACEMAKEERQRTVLFKVSHDVTAGDEFICMCIGAI